MADGARNSRAYKLGAGLPVNRRQVGTSAVLGFVGAAAVADNASAQVLAILAGRPKIKLKHEPGSTITLDDASKYAIGRVIVVGAPDYDDWDLPTIPSRLRSVKSLDAVHFVSEDVPSGMVRAYVHDEITEDFSVDGSMSFDLDNSIARLAKGKPVMLGAK